MLQRFDPRNRDLVVNINGRLIHREHAAISPFDSAVQGGDAVWEGLRLYDGRIFKLREHPGAAEVIAQGETDSRKVIALLTGPVPGGKRIFYQKQMTHHLLPEIDRTWLGAVTNCFLIRDPAEVIASYIRKNNDPMLEDIGFVQQAEIFDWVRVHTGEIPPVIDACDVLENPEKILRLLCEAVGVGFTDAMLSWPPGLREHRVGKSHTDRFAE